MGEQPTKDVTPQTHSSKDFKLLLKYMRGWKEFIAQNRLRQQTRKTNISSVMSAIEFHESHLQTKGVKALIINQIKAKHAR